MRVLIQQPQFLPWAGFWHKVISSETFVMYAGVQYARDEHQHRVPFMGRWLILPVIATMGQPICEVKVEPKSVHKIGKTLQMECMNKRMPFRKRIEELVDTLQTWDTDSFLGVHTTTFVLMALALGIKPRLIVDDKIREGDKHQKMQGLLRDYGFHDCTLLMGRLGRNLGYEIVPGAKTVAYQELVSDVDPESMLIRIVRDEDPLKYVQSIGRWSDGL